MPPEKAPAGATSRKAPHNRARPVPGAPACAVSLARLLLFCLLPARAADCPQHFAFGQPPVLAKASLEARTRELCFRAFAVLHSGA